MTLNKFKNLIFVVLFFSVIFSFSTKTINAQITNVNSTFGTTEAVLNATITPNGYSTIGWFEYGTDNSLRNKIETERRYVGTTNNPVDFSQRVEGLTPNTTYYFRVITNNGRETIRGAILSFITVPNTVAQNTTTVSTTNYATNTQYTNTGCNCANVNTINTNNNILSKGIRVIDATKVEMNATLTNSENTSAQGYFEWGMNESFGNMSNIENLNSGFSNNVVKVVEGLTPNTTYYYRAVFIKNGKTYTGKTQVFQTPQQTNINTTNYQQNTNINPILTNSNTNNNQNFANINRANTANSLFGNGFVPNSIFGWLIVIIILFSILFVIRRIIAR